MDNFRKAAYRIEQVVDTVACTSYTVSTSSGVGIEYSYTDCSGVSQSGYIGGASGDDSETFCAMTGTVTYGTGIRLTGNGSC